MLRHLKLRSGSSDLLILNDASRKLKRNGTAGTSTSITCFSIRVAADGGFIT